MSTHLTSLPYYMYYIQGPGTWVALLSSSDVLDALVLYSYVQYVLVLYWMDSYKYNMYILVHTYCTTS